MIVRRKPCYNQDCLLVYKASVVHRGCRPCKCRGVHAKLDVEPVAKGSDRAVEEYDTVEVCKSRKIILSGKSVL